MNYKEELQVELKTFKELFINRFHNCEIRDKLVDIIVWYENEIKREERINDYQRHHLGGSPADQGNIIRYP